VRPGRMDVFGIEGRSVALEGWGCDPRWACNDPPISSSRLLLSKVSFPVVAGVPTVMRRLWTSRRARPPWRRLLTRPSSAKLRSLDTRRSRLSQRIAVEVATIAKVSGTARSPASTIAKGRTIAKVWAGARHRIAPRTKKSKKPAAPARTNAKAAAIARSPATTPAKVKTPARAKAAANPPAVNDQRSCAPGARASDRSQLSLGYVRAVPGWASTRAIHIGSTDPSNASEPRTKLEQASWSSTPAVGRLGRESI